MNKGAILHIADSARLLKKFYNYPLFLLLMGIVIYLPILYPGPFLSQVSIILQILLSLAIVVINGHFIDIITNTQKRTWVEILKVYLVRTFCIGLILSILTTAVFFGVWTISQYAGHDISSRPFFYLGKVINKSLMIYMIPLIYYDNSVSDSLSLGFKCLIGNFRYSIPLILMCVIATAFYSTTYVLTGVVWKAINFFSWEAGILIDLAIFISASLILKEKLYPDEIIKKV